MLATKVPHQIIKNINLPACIDCIHYMVNGQLHIGKTSKCTKFGEKNIITGKIIYENVIKSRMDENLCTSKGYYFTSKYLST